jgi:ABC-type transport system involved in cytochrome c biogenesis ATPase subunit
MTFAAALQPYLTRQDVVSSIDPAHKGDLAKLQDLLAQKNSLRRRIALRLLEHRASLWVIDNLTEIPWANRKTFQIDWSAIPWQEIIMALLKVLLMLMPFIL